MNKRFYRCSCFVRSNIYLEQIRAHVHYTNDEQFREQYRHVSRETTLMFRSSATKNKFTFRRRTELKTSQMNSSFLSEQSQCVDSRTILTFN